ncbi:MAG TPA: ribose 5-phosphate isomerase B [Clostridia bacterium]|jgi:ribose 5-phosphate isomerase B|nr:ribose 5-phosphate isomerase B [Clostridia bacterium]
MKVGIGCDHGGIVLKNACIEALKELNIEYVDYGTYTEDSVDYPDYAEKVAKAVLGGEVDKGILLCGTGIGISIAANKFRGIRCAHITNVFSAKASSEHNNANIIAMGGRITTSEEAKEMVLAFFSTPYAGGRHQTRLDKITEIEKNYL